MPSYLKFFYKVTANGQTKESYVVAKFDISTNALIAQIKNVLGPGTHTLAFGKKIEAISELPKNTIPTQAAAFDVRVGHLGRRKFAGGLAKLLNTCYFNAAIQAFLSIPVIFNYLLSNFVRQHTSTCSNRKCILCPLAITLSGVLRCTSVKPSFNPAILYDKLNIISKNMKKWKQEDSHELLM